MFWVTNVALAHLGSSDIGYFAGSMLQNAGNGPAKHKLPAGTEELPPWLGMKGKQEQQHERTEL